MREGLAFSHPDARGCPHQAKAQDEHQAWSPPGRRAREESALVHCSWEKGLWRGQALKKLLCPSLAPPGASWEDSLDCPRPALILPRAGVARQREVPSRGLTSSASD